MRCEPCGAGTASATRAVAVLLCLLALLIAIASVVATRRRLLKEEKKQKKRDGAEAAGAQADGAKSKLSAKKRMKRAWKRAVAAMKLFAWFKLKILVSTYQMLGSPDVCPDSTNAAFASLPRRCFN